MTVERWRQIRDCGVGGRQGLGPVVPEEHCGRNVAVVTWLPWILMVAMVSFAYHKLHTQAGAHMVHLMKLCGL